MDHQLIDKFSPKLVQYLKDVLFKYTWLAILVLVLTNIFFKPVINLVIVPLMIGIGYGGWQRRKNKYVTKIFIEEEPTEKEKRVILLVSLIEFAILMVGLHFLFKGFTTVTGVSETLFNIHTRMPMSVSFVLAAAVVTGMLVILYKIKRTNHNGRLILIYILVDIFILFPYNFIFSYENCVKDNLTQYYGNAMPKLYDNLNVVLSTNVASIKDNLGKVDHNNSEINRRIAFDQNQYDRYTHIDTRNMEPWQIGRIQSTMGRLDREITRLSHQIASTSGMANDTERNANLISNLKGLNKTIKAINGNKVSKDSVSDMVFDARNTFIHVYNTDSLLKKDTAVSEAISKLQVRAESPTDGFFNLLKDLFSWALKDEYSKHINRNVASGEFINNAAQAEWECLAPQKRWFSFLFAILIDLFPLIITLCYIHFIKHRRRRAL